MINLYLLSNLRDFFKENSAIAPRCLSPSFTYPTSISRNLNKSSAKSVHQDSQFPSFNPDACSISSPITQFLKRNITDYHQGLDSSNQPTSASEETSKNDFSHTTFETETSSESLSLEFGTTS